MKYVTSENFNSFLVNESLVPHLVIPSSIFPSPPHNFFFFLKKHSKNSLNHNRPKDYVNKS